MEIKERLYALRELMEREKFDYYIVFTGDPHQSEYIQDYFKTREYLTGFTGSAGMVLVSQNEAILWTDGRYYLQAETQLENSDFVLYKMEPEVPSLLQYLCKHVKPNTRIGVNGTILSEDMGRSFVKQFENGVELLSNYDLIGEIWKDRPAIRHELVYLINDDVSGEKRGDKIEQIRKTLYTDDQAVFVSDPDSIMWLFNMRGSDIPNHPVALSYALITKKSASLFLSLDAVDDEAQRLLQMEAIDLYEYDSLQMELLKVLKNEGIKTVSIDPTATNFSICRVIEEIAMLQNINNFELMPKQIKNEKEIEQIRKAHLLDGVAVTKLIYRLKQSDKEWTELSVSQELEEIRNQFTDYVEPSFETISAYREHAAIVHYSPSKESDKKIEKKGFLLIDAGGQYQFATTDMTRTIAMGELSSDEKKHYTMVLKGNLQLAHAVFLYGCTGRNLDILARTPIWKGGIDYRHGTGHGVGCFLCVHEGPQAFRWKKSQNLPEVVLEPGMVTSDEPGIYIEHMHGIRLENELLCIEKNQNEWGRFLEFENLTLVPFDLDAVCVEELNQEERDWLNDYHNVVKKVLCPFLTDKESEWLCGATRKI